MTSLVQETTGYTCNQGLYYNLTLRGENQVNTRVHAVTLRACGLARKQVLAILGNISPQDCFLRQDDDDDWIARGDAHGARGLHTTIYQIETKPLLWWEEKRLGFRAALLRDWLLDAAR